MKKFKLFLPLILAVILPYSMAKVITTSYAYTLTPPVTSPVTPPVVKTFITVVKPNGGEWLMNGNTYQITWKSSPDVKKVNIVYTNGAFSKNLATGYTGQSYNWKISGLAATKNAKINLYAVGTGGTAFDSSDKAFTILTPKQINPIIVQPLNYSNF